MQLSTAVVPSRVGRNTATPLRRSSSATRLRRHSSPTSRIPVWAIIADKAVSGKRLDVPVLDQQAWLFYLTTICRV